MLLGQSVFAPQTGTTYYGPWMPRQGDGLTAVIEVIASAGGTWSLLCEVETKNNEDSDAAGSVSKLTGSTTLTTVGTQHFSTTGAKELVRFKYTVTGDESTGDKWIHFRANPPIWQPN